MTEDNQPYRNPLSSKDRDSLDSSLRCLAQFMDIKFKKDNKEYRDPFGNSCEAEIFKNEVFEVVPYIEVDDGPEQPYNFKWRDLQVSWYKHAGRGTTASRPITTEEPYQMLKECLESLLKWF